MWCTRSQFKAKRICGFSVIELMLAISIMGVIIYALFTLFNQTQRALRASETQGGVSEKGRAIMEILRRELEQMQPTYMQFSTNQHTTNFYLTVDFLPRTQTGDTNSTVQWRTNVLNSFFFTRKETNRWNVIGYKINNSLHVAGELMRYSGATNFSYANSNFFAATSNFFNGKFPPVEIDTSTNLWHHIADGVVHFKLTPYDVNGLRLAYNSTNMVPGAYRIYRSNFKGTPYPNSDVRRWEASNVQLQQNVDDDTNYTRAVFTSNAVPAYLEMELGMLEQDTLRQFRQMLEDANPNANSFLAEKIGKVHLFRQRIPIRTAAQ